MSKVILHIEDEADDVFLFQRAITKAGSQVSIHVATDGQKAIDYFQATGEFSHRDPFLMPSIILLDLKLPHLFGFEVLKWIRQEAGLAIPVVILSSSENEEDIVAAYDMGANAYLVKPSDTAHFSEIARVIIDFWLTENRPAPNLVRTYATGKAPARVEKFASM